MLCLEPQPQFSFHCLAGREAAPSLPRLAPLTVCAAACCADWATLPNCTSSAVILATWNQPGWQCWHQGNRQMLQISPFLRGSLPARHYISLTNSHQCVKKLLLVICCLQVEWNCLRIKDLGVRESLKYTLDYFKLPGMYHYPNSSLDCKRLESWWYCYICVSPSNPNPGPHAVVSTNTEWRADLLKFINTPSSEKYSASNCNDISAFTCLP